MRNKKGGNIDVNRDLYEIQQYELQRKQADYNLFMERFNLVSSYFYRNNNPNRDLSEYIKLFISTNIIFSSALRNEYVLYGNAYGGTGGFYSDIIKMYDLLQYPPNLKQSFVQNIIQNKILAIISMRPNFFFIIFVCYYYVIIANKIPIEQIPDIFRIFFDDIFSTTRLNPVINKPQNIQQIRRQINILQRQIPVYEQSYQKQIQNKQLTIDKLLSNKIQYLSNIVNTIYSNPEMNLTNQQKINNFENLKKEIQNLQKQRYNPEYTSNLLSGIAQKIRKNKSTLLGLQQQLQFLTGQSAIDVTMFEKNPEIFVENVKSMLVGNTTFINFEELNFNLLIKNIINEWALLNNITPIQTLPFLINYFPKVEMIPLGSSFKVTRTLGKESVSIGSGMYSSISPGYNLGQLVI